MFYTDLGQGYGPLSIQPAGREPRAVLFVFSKAYIPDYARRPMMYNFNGMFRKELDRRLSTVGSLGGWNRRSAFFDNNRDNASLVIPRAQADEVNMSVFSGLWTFVLIITHTRDQPMFTGVPAITSKEIFSGYVLDDPVSDNLVSMGHSDAVNPEALLSTTHHTQININDNVAGSFSVMSDTDMIPQQTAANIQKDGSAVASLRPDKLVEGIIPSGPFDTAIQMQPVPLDQTADLTEGVDTAYTLPVTHLAKLVDGLARSKADIVNMLGDGRTGIGDAMGLMCNNLSSELRPGQIACIAQNINEQKIRPDMLFKINDILVAYPDALINICRQPAGQQVDLVNPMLPTVTNQMSSLISSCLPVLLTEHGFSAINMRYCSYDNVPGSFTRGSYQIFDAKTLCVVSPEVYQAKLQMLIQDIIDNIFGVILANAGEFNVQLNCGIGGASLVDLTLLDYHTQNQNGFTLVDNRMGGLNSSMIGSDEVSLSNQRQLCGVIQDSVNGSLVGDTPRYDMY